jgi:hypothetical protein
MAIQLFSPYPGGRESEGGEKENAIGTNLATQAIITVNCS